MSAITEFFKKILSGIMAFFMGLFPCLNSGSDFTDVRNEIMNGTVSIECTLFDGEAVQGNAVVTLENGKITNIAYGEGDGSDDYFIMPGLIDAHCHVSKDSQVEDMLKNGVTAVCDAAASQELIDSSESLYIWSSHTTVMPGITYGRATAESEIAGGAKYIKVMVDMPAIMGGGLMEYEILKDMVDCAHEKGVKVAAHITTVAAVQQAVNTDVDILIHVPIGEEFPKSLAKEIAEKNIAVVPTLVMMKAFAESPFYGYKDSDYDDAVNAVKLLKNAGADILVGTDANSSFFVPKINHGTSMHEEMVLLSEAGLTAEEILKAATGKVATAYGLENIGTLDSSVVLIKGNPLLNIADTDNIVQVWAEGKAVLK